MIDNSDYCIFYYSKNYAPPRRKNSKKDLFDYQPKSGTKIAYEYAVKKKKLKIINTFLCTLKVVDLKISTLSFNCEKV